jgi:hypothetical protein
MGFLSRWLRKKKPAVVLQKPVIESPVVQHWGEAPADIDKPAWTVVKINPAGITVEYQEKYGARISKDCIGLWESPTQYMLTWKDSTKIILEKSNMVSVEVVKG